MDRYSKNPGDGSWRDNRFRLVASHNHKISWDEYERFTLTSDQPTKASLDWRESRSPQGQRSSWTESRWPIDRIVPGKGERPPNRCPTDFLVNYGKEACGFHGGHLVERTRGRCPHILALTNTRIALRAWREDLGDITRILLTAVADPLARQGARMSDTITLCTRILLTTQDLHGKKIDHGGSSGVSGTRGSRWKGNMADLLSCSHQSRINIL